MAFLDTLVTRKDNAIITDVYRKPTHTNRHLDFFSHHDKQHKISTAETLLHHATKLPRTKQGKEAELNHVTDALHSNNYPQNVISNILKRKSSTRRTNSIPAFIDFKNSQVIDKGSSRIRKTLESWHTVSIDRADNNSRPLPSQYSILLKKNS